MLRLFTCCCVVSLSITAALAQQRPPPNFVPPPLPPNYTYPKTLPPVQDYKGPQNVQPTPCCEGWACLGGDSCRCIDGKPVCRRW